MKVHYLLVVVEDEASFLHFVKTLLADRQNNEKFWESGAAEQFLENTMA